MHLLPGHLMSNKEWWPFVHLCPGDGCAVREYLTSKYLRGESEMISETVVEFGRNQTGKGAVEAASHPLNTAPSEG